jgi:hypothetical protein
METVNMVFFLSLCIVTSAQLQIVAIATVKEVDGLVYVTEPVNAFRMTRHIHLWTAAP